MLIEVRLPELSSGVMDATISLWHYTEGDTVTRDDDFVEIVTDKSTFNIPSPGTGRVKELFFREGERVVEGDLLATIEPKS